MGEIEFKDSNHFFIVKGQELRFLLKSMRMKYVLFFSSFIYDEARSNEIHWNCLLKIHFAK